MPTAAQFYFLEVNTRLQVEHGVTEEVFGVDLVEWMMRLARATAACSTMPRTERRRGHSIQVRVYAEDPARDFQPSSGLLTEVDASRRTCASKPGSSAASRSRRTTIRCSPSSSCTARPRATPSHELRAALGGTRIGGIETNLAYLRADRRAAIRFRRRRTHDHAHLASVPSRRAASRCSRPAPRPSSRTTRAGSATGTSAFRRRVRWTRCRCGSAIASSATPRAPPALELTMSGPTLRFRADAVIALTGARCGRDLDGAPVPAYEPVSVQAGQTLKLRQRERGRRARLPGVRGGFDVPELPGQPHHLHARRLRRSRRARAARAATSCTSRAAEADARTRRAHSRSAAPRAHARTGSSACCTVRTARPTSSPPRHRDVVRDASGRCTTTPPAPACA